MHTPSRMLVLNRVTSTPGMVFFLNTYMYKFRSRPSTARALSSESQNAGCESPGAAQPTAVH